MQQPQTIADNRYFTNYDSGGPGAFLANTFERLLDLIQTQHHLDTSQVGPETRLADVGLDSLAVAELLFSIEDVFHVNLSDVAPDAVPVTVADVVSLIDRKLPL